MTKKAEIIAKLKAENPTLRVGNDEEGYTDLTSSEYNEIIDSWAEAELEAEAKIAKEQAAIAAAQAKLVALGLTAEDLKAFGL